MGTCLVNLVYLLALRLHSGSGLLVEGEEVKWIRVKDGLPEEYERVHVKVKDRGEQTAWFEDVETGIAWLNEDDYNIHVTSWRYEDQIK